MVSSCVRVSSNRCPTSRSARRRFRCSRSSHPIKTACTPTTPRRRPCTADTPATLSAPCLGPSCPLGVSTPHPPALQRSPAHHGDESRRVENGNVLSALSTKDPRRHRSRMDASISSLPGCRQQFPGQVVRQEAIHGHHGHPRHFREHVVREEPASRSVLGHSQEHDDGSRPSVATRVRRASIGEADPVLELDGALVSASSRFVNPSRKSVVDSPARR